jgi:hypothetical protein
MPWLALAAAVLAVAGLAGVFMGSATFAALVAAGAAVALAAGLAVSRAVWSWLVAQAAERALEDYRAQVAQAAALERRRRAARRPWPRSLGFRCCACGSLNAKKPRPGMVPGQGSML